MTLSGLKGINYEQVMPDYFWHSFEDCSMNWCASKTNTVQLHLTDPSRMWTPLYQWLHTWSQRNQNSYQYLPVLCTILCPVLSCCLLTFTSTLLFLPILLPFVCSFTVPCGPVCGKIRLLVFLRLHWFTCCTVTFSDLAEVQSVEERGIKEKLSLLEQTPPTLLSFCFVELWLVELAKA